MATIAFVTVPFQGHCNLLARAAAAFAETERTACVHFIVCGWPNVKAPDLLNKLAERRFQAVHMLETKDALTSTDPLEFNVSRARELTPKLCELLQSIGLVDRVIYDFFALEAIVAVRRMHIPATCSLAAFVGQERTSLADEHVRALMELGAALSPEECECMSDGAFVRFPGLRIWCYAPQMLFPPSRAKVWADTPVDFVPEYSMMEQLSTHRSMPDRQSERSTVLLSFGTVLASNLWHQNASVREPLTQLMIALVRGLQTVAHTYGLKKLMVVSDNSELAHAVLDATRCAAEDSPSPMEMVWTEMIDQVTVLAEQRIRLFITHGGCASVREAALSRTPMMVIPWFGDQHESAARVEQLYWGLACPYVDGVDACYATRLNAKRTLWTRACLATPEAVNRMLCKVLDSLSTFEHTLRGVDDVPDGAFFRQHLIEQHCHVPWREGDLLYGTNGDRARFAQAHEDKTNRFHVGDLRPFHQLYDLKAGQRPRLIDQYHDAIFSGAWRSIPELRDDETLQAYVAFLESKATETAMPALAKEVKEIKRVKEGKRSRTEEQMSPRVRECLECGDGKQVLCRYAGGLLWLCVEHFHKNLDRLTLEGRQLTTKAHAPPNSLKAQPGKHKDKDQTVTESPRDPLGLACRAVREARTEFDRLDQAYLQLMAQHADPAVIQTAGARSAAALSAWRLSQASEHQVALARQAQRSAASATQSLTQLVWDRPDPMHMHIHINGGNVGNVTKRDRDLSPETLSVWQMCCDGIEFFVQRGHTIHVAIGPNFEHGRNLATTMELAAIAHWLQRNPQHTRSFRFYVLHRLKPTGDQCYWRRLDHPEDHFWFHPATLWSLDFTRERQAFEWMRDKLDRLQADCRDSLPFNVQGRLKTRDSYAEKVFARRDPHVDDVVGFRLTVEFTPMLVRLVERLVQDLDLGPCIQRCLVAERGRVLYLLGRTPTGCCFEIQLWTNLLWTLFSLEHARVYKPLMQSVHGPKEAEHVRRLEHQLQDVLDQACGSDCVLNALVLH